MKKGFSFVSPVHHPRMQGFKRNRERVQRRSVAQSDGPPTGTV